jgi:hypothetical protein
LCAENLTQCNHIANIRLHQQRAFPRDARHTVFPAEI